MRLLFLIIVIFLISSNVSASEVNKEARDYLEGVVDLISVECKDLWGLDKLICIEDQTPEKCKPLAYLINEGSGWQSCVLSCGVASTFSKLSGKCSK